ncbi:MAG: hypothetical protein JSU95_17050 [Betaproteobacteria bacterium]|nr:MAG: hypothetical protein JSU95_17050 [Betaproteobacteria bacterium]
MPRPLPPIHPEPEYRVSGQRAQWYADMKQVFQVPWMGVVTMAFAHYPYFFEVLWQGLKPLAQSKPFVDACTSLRSRTEARVAALGPGPLVRRLETIGYAPREIDQIRASIEVFSHGNFPYLLTATAARRLLEGLDLGSSRSAPRYSGRHAPQVDAPFVLMEMHHADQDTRALYEEIKATLGLPFVNTDYRALARWPSYFALAWRDLKPLVTSSEHAGICEAVHAYADELVGDLLPNPAALTPDALQEAARNDGSPDEILQVTQLFQWLLPGLVTNVAFFRAQLVV